MSNSNLKIKVKIPTDYRIEFNKWIPNSDNFMHFIIDDDVECVIYFSNENIKENNNWVNPTTRKPLSFNEILTNDWIYANEISFILILKNVNEKLLLKVKNGERDDSLAYKINSLIIETINRFSYCIRNELGHYYIKEIPPYYKNWCLANFAKWKAKFKIGDEEQWKDLKLASCNRIPIEKVPAVLIDKDPIKKEHIPLIKEFIMNKNKKSSIQKILSTNIKMHYKEMNYRVALIEAIIVLETVLNEFLQKTIGKNFKQHIISTEEIKTFWIDVGLSKMIRVGLRWWFSEEELSNEILIDIGEAYNTRNNIIHNSQREVLKEKIKIYLSSIFYLCNFLIQKVN